MNPTNKWVQWAGYGLNALIAAMMLLAGAVNLLATAGLIAMPQPEGAKPTGLENWGVIIAVGQIVSALLLLAPRISPIGVLLTSGFWGGTICFHMSRGEPFLMQSMLLALTWVGAYLRGSVPLVVGERTAPPVGN